MYKIENNKDEILAELDNLAEAEKKAQKIANEKNIATYIDTKKGFIEFIPQERR